MQFTTHSMQLVAKSLAIACLGCFALSRMGYAGEFSLAASENSLAQSESGKIGDTVDQLGDNLMLVHQDSKNQWWFATWGDGLYRYDGKSVVRFTTKHGLLHNRTDQILEDSAGNLHFNTLEGISRFDGNEFTTLPLSPIPEWKLSPGDLWFKDPRFQGKVYRYDGKTLHSLQLPKVKVAEDFISKHPGTPSPYGVYVVYRDRLENVWFGTAASGVLRYDGKSFDWLTSDDVTEFHDGPSNGVRSIIEVHEGKFWFNTRFRYFVQQPLIARSGLDNAQGIFKRLAGIGSLDGKPDGLYEYLSIAQDRDQSLWIATYRNGVYRYDGKDVKHYPIMDGSRVVKLFSVYCDRAGTIWLGTHEDGAYRFNGTAFARFKTGG